MKKTVQKVREIKDGERKAADTVIRLVAAQLNGESGGQPLNDLSPQEWSYCFRIASEQALLAVVWDEIVRRGDELLLPREVRLRWALSAERIEERYRRQVVVCGELARLYGSRGIRMMLLKGLGLSRWWPVPQHRECGDLDIWLYGRQREGDRLVEERWKVPIDNDSHHHTIFVVNGVMVENHYDFVDVHAHRSSARCEAILKELSSESDNPETMVVEGGEVDLPEDHLNALFLMRHMATHFAAERVNLRQVCDWGLFLQHRIGALNRSTINELFEMFRLSRFASVVGSILIEKFGFDPSLFPEASECDVELRQRILDDMLFPEFGEKKPAGGLVPIVCFKIRRFFANRWKHRIVWPESLAETFVRSTFSHFMKPKTIRK